MVEIVRSCWNVCEVVDHCVDGQPPPSFLDTFLKCFFGVADEAEEQREERSHLENGDLAVPHDCDISEPSVFLCPMYFLSRAKSVFTNVFRWLGLTYRL